jgi:prephenate dehydrogenase
LAPSPTDPPFERVAILGLGVMGGSLARALAGLDDPPHVLGWSPNASERDAALEAGAVAEAPAGWHEAVAAAELVVLAAPLRACCDLLAGVAAVTPAVTTLSDVASLKAPLARAAAEAGVSDRWVGCHPMAGSERSGFEASRRDLYHGARVWTVASPAASSRADRVHALWRSVGARPEAIDAGAHDTLMARASHLPQLASNALASVLARAGVAPEQLGPGGRDATRLAGSDAGLWRDLFEHAAPELAHGLYALAGAAERIARLLDEGDLDGLEELMRSTRAWRQS